MKSTLLRAAALVAALLPVLSPAASLSLEQVVALAVQRSDAARSARHGAVGASEAARAAGQLPDPALRVGVDNLPISGGDRFSTRDAMTMKRIGVAQEWLPSEKRAARQATAEAMVRREAVSVQLTEAEVRLQTGLAYVDAYFANEALKLAVQAEHHVHEEVAAAVGRMTSPAGSSQDVLAVTGARGIAEDDTAEIRQQQAAARVALERWVGIRIDELTPPDGWGVPDERKYVAAHPRVAAARRDLELARKEVDMASADRNPNWSWEISYGQRAGNPDMISFGVSIPLPVARAQRQDRDVASRLALAEKVDADLAEATRMATGEYRALASDASRLRERIDRFRISVVATAQQRTASALAGYRSNQTPLMVLFDARHAEVEAQRKLLNLQRDLARTELQLAFKPLAEGGAE
jgi:outer membrane protein TolC